MVDKYEAKKYVGHVIGEKYVIPTLGVWDHFDDIDFDKSMIFVWLNDVIVGSVVIPIDNDIDITFWVDNTEYKSFNNYEDFRKFYNEEYKNLVK